MKKIIVMVMLVLIAIMLVSNAYAQENKEITLVLFYGQGCPHCAALEDYLNDLKKEYVFDIVKYEIYFNTSNIKIFDGYAKQHNTTIKRVPTLFINDKVFEGFTSEVAYKIREEIAVKNPDKITGKVIGDTNNNMEKAITIPAVILAAFVDSINPCEFAILILLLTTILVAGNRKKALFAGIAFSIAIYLSYFFMGLGLYSAIKISGLSRTLYIIFAFIAILVGLFNLKDYFWYGKGFLMEVPLSWRPAMKKLVTSVTSIPGAFILGIIISLFLLPCTSGPYIIILGMLAETATRNSAILLLMLYNLIFILPMLIITFSIYYGLTTTEKAEQWRIRKLRILHLIAGIILLILGIGMILSSVLHWI